MRPLNSCPAGRGVAGGRDFNQRVAALSAVMLRGRSEQATGDLALRGHRRQREDHSEGKHSQRDDGDVKALKRATPFQCRL